MEPCLGVGARLEQLDQGLSRLRVAAMKKQPLGGVARPATRAVERGDELRGDFVGVLSINSVALAAELSVEGCRVLANNLLDIGS